MPGAPLRPDPLRWPRVVCRADLRRDSGRSGLEDRAEGEPGGRCPTERKPEPIGVYSPAGWSHRYGKMLSVLELPSQALALRGSL